MYLPKHQYTEEKSQDVPTLTDENGKTYKKSSVIRTSAGQYFDVPPSDLLLGIFTNAIQLFTKELLSNILNSDSEVIQNYETTPIVFNPTNSRVIGGRTNRYFIKNTSTGKIKEISEEDFDKTAKKLTLYELIGLMEWQLEGPIEDIKVKDRIYEGAKSLNRRATLELNKRIPGIKDLITDYTQYVQETPSDIIENSKPVPQKTAFYIPAPGKEL